MGGMPQKMYMSVKMLEQTNAFPHVIFFQF